MLKDSFDGRCPARRRALAWSQSSVQIYGIVDAAVRHATNEGPARRRAA